MRNSHTVLLAMMIANANVAFAQNVGTQSNRSLPELTTPPATNYRLPTLPAVSAAEGAPLQQTAALFVKEIRVESVTALDRESVKQTIAPYTNRVVSSAELQALRTTLTRMYVEKGYVSSGVLLPDQDVRDGVVTYRAVEGSLTRIELVGSPHLRAPYVEAKVRRFVDAPLNVADLQYALRYLEQDPIVRRLDAALAPGANPGESVLRLRLTEEPRFSIGLSADNHRSSSTGAERGVVSFSTQNLTGWGEEFVGSVGLSDGTDEHAFALAVPIHKSGATVELAYSRSDASIIEDAFETLDIDSESTSSAVRVRYPFIDDLDTTVAVTVGFEANKSRTSLLGMPFSFSPGAQNGESKTSVGSIGADWLRRGTASVAAARLTYRHGFDVLDATIDQADAPGALFDSNPTGADGEFSNFQLQGTYIHRLNALPFFNGMSERGQVIVRTVAQLSQDPLLSLEKFAIGGVNTVRGYPENLLVRDNGVAATVEMQVPIPGYRSDAHPLNLVVAPFIDYGRSWDEADTDPGSDVRNTDSARYLISAGLGLLWQPLAGLNAQVYWGADLSDNFAGDDPRQFRDRDLQDDGVHFSVSYVARW